MQSKKTTILICLVISLLCTIFVITFTFAEKMNPNTRNIIINLSYALLGSAFITLLLTVKDYKGELKEILEKMFILFLRLDNEVGRQKYYANNLSLDKLANTIASCVDYTMDINLCVLNIYKGLFRLRKKTRKIFHEFGEKLEMVYLKSFYALGQILENDKEYAKKHIKDIYNELINSIYNENIYKEMENILEKYKSDFKFNWLADDPIINLHIKLIKEKFANGNVKD